MRFRVEVLPGNEAMLAAETDYAMREISRELGRSLTVMEDIALRRLIEEHAIRVAQIGLLDFFPDE
jgi:hypothetical protein